jgi:uncharacterized iron-regulated membrane protein
MAWLHTWVGLLLSVVLYFMFVTGTAGYVHPEITRWMQPERAAAQTVRAVSNPALAARAVAVLQADMPVARAYYIGLPSARGHGEISIFGAGFADGKQIDRRLDPATLGPVRQYRETGGGEALYAMHYALHYLPGDLSMYIVGAATMFMLIAILTGVVVHRKIFADFFTFRPGKGQRSWLDAHNLASVLALPFLVMITYSGLLFYTFDYAPAAKWAVYGTGPNVYERLDAEVFPSFSGPRPTDLRAPVGDVAAMIAVAEAEWGAGQVQYFDIQNPGFANAVLTAERQPVGTRAIVSARMQFDAVSGARLPAPTGRDPASTRVSELLIRLHEGQFAPPALRWLYVLAGLSGAAMVATGMVLWTAKRRQRLRHDAAAGAGLRFVERLNLGVIVGLPIGIAAYFWANRLLPPGLEGRADWELHILFFAWALVLALAALRPAAGAWPLFLGAAALMFGLIPLLNALTTDIHLGRTLPVTGPGDPALAAFDLSMLLIAGGFAVAAWYSRNLGARATLGPDAATSGTVLQAE